jgi:3-hydroxyisobutyrate dehydrogenase-like beta-hydroxyacid dehydrogenase
MAKIAVLGVGAMGSRMAASLLRAGHDVIVWNRDAERTKPLLALGAAAGTSPADAVAGVDFALSMVRDIEASHAVWLDPETGALSTLAPSAIAIECSTITVGWARELSETFAKKGIALIDAPVSGSRKQAEAGELIFLVGGADDAVEAARPILLAIGKSVEHIGGAGCGVAMKLMVNASMAVQMANVAELLAMTTENGIPREKAMDVFTSTAICSPWMKANAPGILERDYAPQFTVALVEKDVRYAIQAAKTEDVGLPLTKVARIVYGNALSAGLGEENLTAVSELYNKR